MQKLSVLIFSKNDVHKAIELIDDLYGIADEIVVVDSSESAQRNMLLNKKKSQKLEKLRVFYTIALGYPDPLRMYALSKCRNEWVLLIDTDERLSNALRSGIKGIINKTDCSAFRIKRYEGTVGAPFAWQTRLFRKRNVEFKGLLHEQPRVDGEVCTLSSKQHYMEHRAELKKHKLYEANDYTDMRMFDSHPSHLYIRDIYFFSTSLSTDYLRSIKMLHGKSQEWKNRKDYQEIRQISRIINKEGIIKFLGLDREETINHLNKKYGSKRQGVTLLINLLKNKYEGKPL
jgi:hypothetical protein